MNILLFSDSFYPEKNSAAKLLYDLVMYVSNQQGHNIDVFTISQKRINLNGPKLNIYECILKRHKNKSNLVRGIFELYSGFYFMFLHIRYKFACKHDYIIYYNPSVLQIVFLIYLRLVSRKSKFMLILRDVFPDWAIELGIIRSLPVKVFLLFCKKINILLADTIFCESKNKLDLIRSQFPKADVKLLYNWIYFRDFKKGSKITRKYKKFIYAGNVGKAQDILSCSRFIKNITELGHKVHFYSSGNELEKLKHKLGYNKNMKFIQPVSLEKLNSIMINYDGGLVFLSENLVLDNIPGKILSYLENGLPVFGAVNSGNEIISILEKNGLGLVVGRRSDLHSDIYRRNIIEFCNKSKPKKVWSHASLLFNVKTASDIIFKESI